MSGALPGRSYLEKLEAAGFEDAEVLEATGYATSPFTQGHLIRAIRS